MSWAQPLVHAGNFRPCCRPVVPEPKAAVGGIPDQATQGLHWDSHCCSPAWEMLAWRKLGRARGWERGLPLPAFSLAEVGVSTASPVGR